MLRLKSQRYVNLFLFRFWNQDSCLDVFLKSTSPSSLYEPVDYWSSLFNIKDSIWMPTSSQISVFMYWNISIFICMYIYIHTYVCIYVCIYICMYVYIYVYMHVYIFVCIYIYICMCVYIYIYIYVCVFIYRYRYIDI